MSYRPYPDAVLRSTRHLNGSVTVENVGEVTDEQNVSVSFGDETLVDRAVELDGGASEEIEFNRTLTAADAGDTTLTATTDDDIATRTVSVLRPGTLEVDVIDDESTLSPVANQNVSVVAEIENVGEAGVVDRKVNLTNITGDANNEVASREFSLAPGESEDFDPSVETTDGDAGSELTYEIATGDDTETVTADVGERSPFLDVTIDGLNESSVTEPEAGETESVRVDATVENLGGDVSGNVTFTVNGDEFATRDFDRSDGTQTYNVTYDVELGDAPEVTVGAEAKRGDDDEPDTTDETPLDVTSQAQFAVSIDEPTNVTEDLSEDEFAPTIDVENVGEQSGSGNVTVFFNGTEQDTIDFSSIGSGGSTTVIEPEGDSGFSINASDFEEGDYLLEAEVANDATEEMNADTDRVAIGQPANFAVEDVSVASSVDQGETIDIEATINNTGGVTAEKPVTFEFGGTTLETTDLNLSEDDSPVTESVTYTPTSADAGSVSDVTVSTPDDESTQEVDVRENAEFTADLTVDESAIAGDTVTAGVTVTNDGGDAGNATDVRLLADGQEVASTDVELASGEQTTEQFELSPESAGELAVQGVTDDDVSESTVDVGEPGELDISVRSITDPVTTDENVTVSVAAENVGDGDLEDRRVRLSIDGSLADTTTVDVAGGATETVELTSELDRTVTEGETETADVSVVTPEDRVDRGVTVRPEPDDAYFRVDGLEANADEVLNTDDANVTVNATVTNIGDRDGTQNVTFTAGDAVSATNESLSIDGNGTAREVSFEFDVSELDLTLNDEESTDVTYVVASETDDQTEEGTLTVTGPDPPTPELTEVAIDETATQDDPLTATITVRNAGDQPLDGNETVTLAYEDGTVANDSVGLNASESVEEGESLDPGAEAEVGLAV
ncbi:CARDB domain-containing protein, partial [Halorubrum pallidum]